LALGCHTRTTRIDYVLPNEYRGAFIIYTNSAGGITLPRAVNNGLEVVTCSIPRTGVLYVCDDYPFYRWHRVQARFENGEPLPVASKGDQLPAGIVALWGGGSRGGGMIYDFVGTTTEAEKFFDETASGPVLAGGVRDSSD
jgi:hypothetical protein